MSHTAVFETSYQTPGIRANLPAIAFGNGQFDRDKGFFTRLRTMSLTRDEGAPVSVPKEQTTLFEERRDIKVLCEQLLDCPPEEKKKIPSQTSNMRANHYYTTAEANRRSYFDKADRLLLLGLEPKPSPGAGGPGGAADLAGFLCQSRSLDRCSLEKKSPVEYIKALRSFLCPPTASVSTHPGER
ncbi:hypothetical protein CONLIGDRAFT_587413 [Coniochaeta ligniaria NRRL 30616]|uniref:Uncharacterized protein n=1 Tax=Coniochaeta ligniaria NRRL 30616 TaxID=1408157 RepID=A0A1J7J4N4_9PEZI|nr:hypothetical protein CONLIGDRAFT_587413 [Coniochaeta ligniaria NRRL 30616]